MKQTFILLAIIASFTGNAQEYSKDINAWAAPILNKKISSVLGEDQSPYPCDLMESRKMLNGNIKYQLRCSNGEAYADVTVRSNPTANTNSEGVKEIKIVFGK